MRTALIRVPWLLAIVACALALVVSSGGEAFAAKKKPKKKRPAKVTAPAQASPAKTPPAAGPVLEPKLQLEGPATNAASAKQDEAFGKTFKIKVMVYTLKGTQTIDPTLLTGLSQSIAETLDRLGPFKAVTVADVERMLEHETNRQLTGCTDESCLAEIGGALGADFIVSGTLATTGATSFLQLQLLNVGTGNVDQRVARDYQGPSDGLFAEARNAGHALMREILGARAGTLALEVSEEGASIKIDGSIVGVAPMATHELAGGPHRLEIEKAGFIVARQDVQISEGATTRARVVLVPSDDYKQAYLQRATTTRRIAWAAIGTGIAGFAVGTAAFVLGQRDAAELRDDIDAYNALALRTASDEQKLVDREAKLATYDALALGGFVLGAVGITAGSIIWSSGDDPHRYDAGASVEAGSVRTSLSLGLGTLGLITEF